ncbi:hypothetical protein JOC74_004579 [Bacillus capparidis]|uniref:Uncharacterized protein n=1 Tax=Bacillus capparidis TaxID=1840411 RepID=A0ABS4D331_9BACI|nr:hypothetical protein [Bacillus capparidis]
MYTKPELLYILSYHLDTSISISIKNGTQLLFILFGIKPKASVLLDVSVVGLLKLCVLEFFI